MSDQSTNRPASQPWAADISAKFSPTVADSVTLTFLYLFNQGFFECCHGCGNNPCFNIRHVNFGPVWVNNTQMMCGWEWDRLCGMDCCWGHGALGEACPYNRARAARRGAAGEL
jgi:hypothetical protein